MELLLPVLKTSNYKTDDNLLLKEELFESPGSPMIVYAKAKGSISVYQRALSEEDYKEKIRSIKQEAFANLKKIQPKIDIQKALGAKVAFVGEQEYACEKIVDVEFMKAVAQKIGASSLIVGIPFKGTLIAADANSKISQKFPGLIKKYFENPQQEPISGEVFLVRDGEIVAISGSGSSQQSGKSTANIPSAGFAITELSETHNYKVELDCSSIKELSEKVNASYRQILVNITETKQFGGEITFHIGPSLPLDSTLIDKCHDYVSQVEQNEKAQAILKLLTKVDTSFAFYYDGKKIAPQQGWVKLEASSKKKWWQLWK